MAPRTPHSPHGAISDSRLQGTRLTPATAATRHARSTGDLFRCPELDQRMKSYLVRLAQETATHLVRDSLNPRAAPSRVRLDSDAPPAEGEAERLPEVVWTSTGNVKGVNMQRGTSETKDACCMRGSVDVNASIEEFALLFKMDSKRELAEHGLLFNPDILDLATLYALVQPSGDHPRRYVGIKWCLLQGPSKLFHNRDLCFLECQKEFRDPIGRRGWVRSMHSIKLPCCPSFHKSHGIVRASLYRCGLVAVESSKPGVLEVTYTLEMDLKGHFPDLLQTNFLTQRIAALGAVNRCLQQQRLSSSPLLGDLEINREKMQNRACHYCYRGFSTFSKRHMCRRCSECVCKHCSDDWELDIPVIGRQKVRICTVCSAEARFSHTTPEATRGTARRATIASLQNSRGASTRRETAATAGTGMLGPPRVTEQRRKTYGALIRTPRSNRSQSAAASRATQQYNEPELYDYESTGDQDYGSIQPNHIRGTTDLSHMWEPQDTQSGLPSPSPSSYFPVQPLSFSAEPVTPSAARPSYGVRYSRQDRDTMPFRMEDMQRPSSIANAPPQQPTVQIWERPSRTPRSYQPPSPAPVHHQFQQYQQEPPRQSYRNERVPATPPPQRVSSYHLESLHHRNRAFSDSDSWEVASNENSSTRGGRSIAHQVLARQREKKLRAKSVERHEGLSRETAQPSPAARPQPIVPNFFRGATFGMTRNNTDRNNSYHQQTPVDGYQDQDLQQNGPPSPVPSAESVEYVETEDGEWIPGKRSESSRRGDKIESASSAPKQQPKFEASAPNNERQSDMHPLKSPFDEIATDPAMEVFQNHDTADEDDGYTTSRRTFPSLLVDDGEPMMVPLHMDHQFLAYQPTRAS